MAQVDFVPYHCPSLATRQSGFTQSVIERAMLFRSELRADILVRFRGAYNFKERHFSHNVPANGCWPVRYSFKLNPAGIPWPVGRCKAGFLILLRAIMD
jgi:hypothetical protein